MNMSYFTSETAEQRRAVPDRSTNHMITASIASHIIHSRALFSYIYAMRQTSYLGILYCKAKGTGVEISKAGSGMNIIIFEALDGVFFKCQQLFQFLWYHF